MAPFRKLTNGRVRVQIERRGVRKSKIFSGIKAAKDWAAREEYLILNAETVKIGTTFGEMLDRYAREVPSQKRGARWEIFRIEKIRRDDLARKRMGDLKPEDFPAWRDKRLLEVAPASVAREMQLMSSAMNVARREWGIINANPLSDDRYV